MIFRGWRRHHHHPAPFCTTLHHFCTTSTPPRHTAAPLRFPRFDMAWGYIGNLLWAHPSALSDCECAWNCKYLRLQLQLKESRHLRVFGGYLPSREDIRTYQLQMQSASMAFVHVSGSFISIAYQAATPCSCCCSCCCNCSSCCSCCHWQMQQSIGKRQHAKVQQI